MTETEDVVAVVNAALNDLDSWNIGLTPNPPRWIFRKELLVPWLRALTTRCEAAEATNANNLGLLEVIEQVGVERDRYKQALATNVSALVRAQDAIVELDEKVRAIEQSRDDYRSARDYCKSEMDRLVAENGVLVHEASLIEADTRSGITDCSTPLFQRVRNIVEQRDRLAAELAEAKREVENEQKATRATYRAGYEHGLAAEREAHARTRAELAEAQATIAHWERHEVQRGSCCSDNEARADRAEGILRELRACLSATPTNPRDGEIRDNVVRKLDDLEATHDRR